jgi:hypothetical protein
MHGHGRDGAAAQEIKVFCFFSSEKKNLSFLGVLSMELAHINVARFRLPADDPANADFVAMLDRVNAEADAAPGFLWRLIDEAADPADLQVFGDPRVLVNMSVWKDIESLQDFTYGTGLHREMIRRRGAWFERMEIFLALWWVKDGHRPCVAEGKSRLEHLRSSGASPEAFTFARRFAPDGAEMAVRAG